MAALIVQVQGNLGNFFQKSQASKQLQSPPYQKSQKFLVGKSSAKCFYLIGLSIRPGNGGAQGELRKLPIDELF
jgi:hypothetical protein